MKVIVQIPCFNEADTLPQVLASIPRRLPQVDAVQILVIDDGSTDNTSGIAKEHGADFVFRNKSNLGLARSFSLGIEECLRAGADIIVNIDGDNQYDAAEIPKLIEPLLRKEADIVIGDRRTSLIPSFTKSKKFFQRSGSALVAGLARLPIRDAASGFRAFNKTAALRLTIFSSYSYTIESLLQARAKGLTVKEVEVHTNPPTRESRLMKNMWEYMASSAATIARVFAMYNPLRIFCLSGGILTGSAAVIGIRFLYFYFTGSGAGHVQSLVLAAICAVSGVTILMVGLLADLIQFNRRLEEEILARVREIELKLNAPR